MKEQMEKPKTVTEVLDELGRNLHNQVPRYKTTKRGTKVYDIEAMLDNRKKMVSEALEEIEHIMEEVLGEDEELEQLSWDRTANDKPRARNADRTARNQLRADLRKAFKERGLLPTPLNELSKSKGE